MTRRWIGAIVLALGLLALAYGGFTYTKDSHSVDLGFVELKAREKERVQVPPWVGVVGVVVGAVLLTTGRKK